MTAGSHEALLRSADDARHCGGGTRPPVLVSRRTPVRWTPKRKAMVVRAILAGDLDGPVARVRFDLSEEELSGWVSRYVQHGVKGAYGRPITHPGARPRNSPWAGQAGLRIFELIASHLAGAGQRLWRRGDIEVWGAAPFELCSRGDRVTFRVTGVRNGGLS
jgi:hypothetical protein